MAGEDCRQPAMLEEESRRRRVCHTPSRTAHVKQGKITVLTHMAHALGFRPRDLVAVVDGGRRRSATVGAPPQVGSVTPSALKVGVSKKHPTALLLFSVLLKICLF